MEPPQESPHSRMVTARFAVQEYDLAATLDGGQAFRWRPAGEVWHGVIGSHWVELRAVDAGIEATITARNEAAGRQGMEAVAAYLRVDDPIREVLAGFPDDEPMRTAVAHCRGLRLLRQEPWECLASFICSSTKQIVQIQQIVALLCERFGPRLDTPAGVPPCHGFPSIEAIAGATEVDLRACKLGFRAPYLLGTARAIAEGRVSLEGLRELDTSKAREALESFPGVGRKIADCVLLFAYGRQDAFPVDVWVQKALRGLYFPRARRLSSARLLHFSQTHFGAWGGYAQQYLFHYVRVHLGRNWEPPRR